LFYHTYVTHIKDREAGETTVDKLGKVIGGAVVVGLGLASVPIWLPPLAAKGAAILASHGTGLTAAAIVTVVKSLAKGRGTKEVAHELASNAGITIAFEGPLENWIKELKDHIA
jgi:hypothetical protein